MSLLSIIEKSNIVVVISKKHCINCQKLKVLFKANNVVFENIIIENLIDQSKDSDIENKIFEDIETLKRKWGIKSYPMTFNKNEYIGDYNKIKRLNTFEMKFNSVFMVNEDF
jgi:hypothetical protein